MNPLLVRAVSMRTGLPPDVVEKVADGIVDWLKEHPDAVREIVGRADLNSVDLPGVAYRLGTYVRKMKQGR
jgi:hypothetical protein